MSEGMVLFWLNLGAAAINGLLWLYGSHSIWNLFCCGLSAGVAVIVLAVRVGLDA